MTSHFETLRIRLVCSKCRHGLPVEATLDRCSFCGGSLEFQFPDEVDFPRCLVTTRRSLWRYLALLSVAEENVVSLGEGLTPEVFLEDLSDVLQVSLYAKMESENPSGTFKDREAALEFSRMQGDTCEPVVFQSTGNTLISKACYAGLCGREAFGFLPAQCRYKLYGPAKAASARIIAVRGDPIDVKHCADRFARTHGFRKLSAFHQRCEANATIAYEIGEGILTGRLPQFDYYVQTIAAGMGFIGFVRGMARLATWTRGAVHLPKCLGIQISEFCPVHEAWMQGRCEVGEEGQTPRYGARNPFEPTLHTTNAPAYYPDLRNALKTCGGNLAVVQPSEARDCEEMLRASLQAHGYDLAETERAAFIALAGLITSIRNGTVARGSSVLLCVTGKALRADFVHYEPDAVIDASFDCFALLDSLRDPSRLSAA